MKRTIDIDKFYRTNDIRKALEKFSKAYPVAAPFSDFDEGCTEPDILSSLPMTDKYWADGKVNNEWTYYFDIDAQEDGYYIWYIERA